jgi:hypothetical protein
MNILPSSLKMVTRDQLDRPSVLKGASIGAGVVVLHALGDQRENFGVLDARMPAQAQAGPLTEILA